jgi:predicted nucleic acid-binding protein
VIRQYLMLPSTPETCRQWGQVRYARRFQPISTEDAWIAASALAFDCTLVTHDAGDFAGIPGLRVLTALGTP